MVLLRSIICEINIFALLLDSLLSSDLPYTLKPVFERLKDRKDLVPTYIANNHT